MTTAVKVRKGVEQYEFDPGESQTRRIAHFLNWAADHMPKEFLPYNVVLKAITGYKHLPRLDTKEVESVRSAMSRVRKILLQTYRRGTVTMPGVGVRATIDDADMVIHDVTKKGKRAEAAFTSYKESVNAVDVTKIPKTAEMAPYQKYIRGAKDVVALFGSDDFMKKLLPPNTEKKE